MFNSALFICFFLPIVLIGCLLLPHRFLNLWLLVASFVFYGWTQSIALLLLLIFVLINYRLGLSVAQTLDDPVKAKRILILGITVNIGLLALLKIGVIYILPLIAFSGELAKSGLLAYLKLVTHYFIYSIDKTEIALPLGISFLVFHAISYLVDVYKKRIVGEKSGLNFALYMTMFPKITAGPIVRYQDISRQLTGRAVSTREVAQGIRRFILGLGKKTLVADMLKPVVDSIFSMPMPGVHLTTELAWFGAVVYALQIYYDFSGYSDMAIGLAQIFGFQLPENFNYPYVARSISEFWRRWHITLSNWFRDYVFFPLERRRQRQAAKTQTFNILAVFFLTGLWHGVTPNYIAWGLLHGAAIALERTRFGVWLTTKVWRPFQSAYTLIVILSGWVLFRSGTLGSAAVFFKAMVGLTQWRADLPFSVMPPVQLHVWLAIGTGLLFAIPVAPWISRISQAHATTAAQRGLLAILKDVSLLALLAASIVVIITSTYQSYIYRGF